MTGDKLTTGTIANFPKLFGYVVKIPFWRATDYSAASVGKLFDRYNMIASEMQERHTSLMSDSIMIELAVLRVHFELVMAEISERMGDQIGRHFTVDGTLYYWDKPTDFIEQVTVKAYGESKPGNNDKGAYHVAS